MNPVSPSRTKSILLVVAFFAVAALLSAIVPDQSVCDVLGMCFAPARASAAASSSAEGAPPAEAADFVITNAVVYTGEPSGKRAQAIAVRGERIVAVGSNKDIARFTGPQTRTVDAKGAFIMPGFNDAHVHIGGAGAGKLAINFEGARSIEEMQRRIRERVATAKPGEWITGRGWDHTLWPVKRFPTRHDLDAVSKDHPMFFGRVDGHVSVVNSKALELAGITKATPNPPGGEIEKDASGEPTGMLKEGSAAGLVGRLIPSPTPEQRRRGIELALADVARHGVTSLQDNSSWQDFLAYSELKKEGKLTARISEWLPFGQSVERLKQMQAEGGTTDPWLRTAGLKGVTDGALGGRTAAMAEPYSDAPDSRGILIIPADRLKQMVVERDKAGFQINLHAIGDLANRAALDAFAAARAANPKRDARHRIEHLQIIAVADIPRLKQLSVIASMQPAHQTTDSRWAAERVGPERVKGAYAWNSVQKAGARLAFGTDYPVEVISPFRGLFACVTREVDGQPGSSWQPQEKISMDDCIRAYTQGSAYAEFAEKDKGKIAAGQFADFIVLDRDVTRSGSPDILREILGTQVLKTFVGGRLVYEKK